MMLSLFLVLVFNKLLRTLSYAVSVEMIYNVVFVVVVVATMPDCC